MAGYREVVKLSHLVTSAQREIATIDHVEGSFLSIKASMPV